MLQNEGMHERPESEEDDDRTEGLTDDQRDTADAGEDPEPAIPRHSLQAAQATAIEVRNGDSRQDSA